MTNTNEANLIDVTNLCLTDAVMDAVAATKSAKTDFDNPTLDHLSPNELHSYCALLGIEGDWARWGDVGNTDKVVGPVTGDYPGESQVTSGAEYL